MAQETVYKLGLEIGNLRAQVGALGAENARLRATVETMQPAYDYVWALLDAERARRVVNARWAALEKSLIAQVKMTEEN